MSLSDEASIVSYCEKITADDSLTKTLGGDEITSMVHMLAEVDTSFLQSPKIAELVWDSIYVLVQLPTCNPLSVCTSAFVERWCLCGRIILDFIRTDLLTGSDLAAVCAPLINTLRVLARNDDVKRVAVSEEFQHIVFGFLRSPAEKNVPFLQGCLGAMANVGNCERGFRIFGTVETAELLASLAPFCKVPQTVLAFVAVVLNQTGKDEANRIVFHRNCIRDAFLEVLPFVESDTITTFYGCALSYLCIADRTQHLQGDFTVKEVLDALLLCISKAPNEPLIQNFLAAVAKLIQDDAENKNHRLKGQYLELGKRLISLMPKLSEEASVMNYFGAVFILSQQYDCAKLFANPETYDFFVKNKHLLSVRNCFNYFAAIAAIGKSCDNHIFSTATMRDILIESSQLVTTDTEAHAFFGAIASMAVEAHNALMMGTQQLYDVLVKLARIHVITRRCSDSARTFFNAVMNLIVKADDSVRKIFTTPEFHDLYVSCHDACKSEECCNYFFGGIVGLAASPAGMELFNSQAVQDAILSLTPFIQSSKACYYFFAAITNLCRSENGRRRYGTPTFKGTFISHAKAINTEDGVHHFLTAMCNILMLKDTRPIFCDIAMYNTLLNAGNAVTRSAQCANTFIAVLSLLATEKNAMDVFGTPELKALCEKMLAIASDAATESLFTKGVQQQLFPQSSTPQPPPFTLQEFSYYYQPPPMCFEGMIMPLGAPTFPPFNEALPPMVPPSAVAEPKTEVEKAQWEMQKNDPPKVHPPEEKRAPRSLEGKLEKFAMGHSAFGAANWKPRFFTLSEDGVLKYFESSVKRLKPLNTITLEHSGEQVKLFPHPSLSMHPKADGMFDFLLEIPAGCDAKDPSKPSQLLLRAESEATFEKWIASLRTHI